MGTRVASIRYIAAVCLFGLALSAGASRDAVAANSCGSAPLPTAPVGPSSTTTWKAGNSYLPATVTAWRMPCSATESMVVLTLSPPASGTGNTPYVCLIDMTLLQTGGLQATSFNFRNDPPTVNSFCGSVLAPITVALFPDFGTPAAFDFDQGFSIDFDGGSAGHQALAVPAYDPAAYGLMPPAGPNSVNLFVQGANVLYQNCTVTSSPVGGALQYTASCALEAPLKAAQFQMYDY